MQADPQTTQRIMEAFEGGNVFGSLKPRFRHVDGDFRGIKARKHVAECTAAECKDRSHQPRGRILRLCSAGCDRPVQRTARGVVKGSRATGYFFHPVCEPCAHAIIGLDRNQMFADATTDLTYRGQLDELERALDLLTVVNRAQAAKQIAALMPKPAPKAEARSEARQAEGPSKPKRNRRRRKGDRRHEAQLQQAAAPAAPAMTEKLATPVAAASPAVATPAPAPDPEAEAFEKDVVALTRWARGEEGAPTLVVRETCGFDHDPYCTKEAAAGLIQFGADGKVVLVGICSNACRVYGRVIEKLGKRAPRLWQSRRAAEDAVKSYQAAEDERRRVEQERRTKAEERRRADYEAKYAAARQRLKEHFAASNLEEPTDHPGHNPKSVKWTVRRKDDGTFAVVAYCGMAHSAAFEALKEELGDQFRGLKRFESRDEAEAFAERLSTPRRPGPGRPQGREGERSVSVEPHKTGKTDRKRRYSDRERREREAAERKAREQAEAQAQAEADAKTRRVKEVAKDLDCSEAEAEVLIREEEAAAKAKAEEAKRNERKAGKAEDEAHAKLEARGRKPKGGGRNGNGSNGNGHKAKDGDGGGERKRKPPAQGPLYGSGAGIEDMTPAQLIAHHADDERARGVSV